MTKTSEAAITEIIEAASGGKWFRISALAEMGFEPAEVAEAVSELTETFEGFRAEPEPFGHRITEADKRYAVIIGGEARHLVKIG